MTRWSLRFAVGMLMVLPCIARGQDEDMVQAKLDKAQADYDKDIEKAKDALLKLLDKQEEAARKAGKNNLLEQVGRDREALEGSGTLPKSVSTTQYLRSRQQARNEMESAYNAALKQYIKKKMDDEAAGVRAALKSFLEEETTSMGIEPGASWDGVKTWSGGMTWKPGQKQNIRLEISEISGREFKGRFSYGNGPGASADDHKVPIIGVVRGGKIEFTGDGVRLEKYTCSPKDGNLVGGAGNGSIQLNKRGG